MKKLRFQGKVLIILAVIMLQGCTALGWAGKLLSAGGGSTGGVHTSVSGVGDNKNQIGKTENTVKNNAGGSVAGNAVHNYADSQGVTNNNRRHWLSELQQHALTILLVALCFVSFLVLVAWFTRAPQDRRKFREDDCRNKDQVDILMRLLKEKFEK